MGFVNSLLAGSFLAAPILAAVAVWAILAFGFVELMSGEVKQVKLLGRRDITAEEVVSVDLQFQKQRNTKWWFPVLTLVDDSQVELKVLRTVKHETAAYRADAVQAALNGTAFVEPEAATDGEETSVGAASPAEIPDDGFTPLEGLERHYQ